METLTKLAQAIMAFILGSIGFFKSEIPLSQLSKQVMTRSPAESFSKIDTTASYIPEFPGPTVFSLPLEENPPVRPPIYDTQRANLATSIGKPKPRDLGSVETILSLPLFSSCTAQDKDYIHVNLTRALLIKNLPDLHTSLYSDLLKYYPDIGTDAFLIIEGQTQNTDPDRYETVYESSFMKLKRPNSTYGTRDGYSRMVLAHSTGYFAGYFPVRLDENTFSLLFCYATKPVMVPLDFTSSESQTVYGRYNMDLGLQESK